MDSLSHFVNSHIGDNPGKDIRLSATTNKDGSIQLHGEKKPNFMSMMFAKKKDSFDLAQQAVKQAIEQVKDPEIRSTLNAIYEKKMEDSYMFGKISGHKNSLSMEALHSITAAYESLTNPDAAEARAVQASMVTFSDIKSNAGDEVIAAGILQNPDVATTYAECLDRLDVSLDLIRDKYNQLEEIEQEVMNQRDQRDYKAEALLDKTLEPLEAQLEKLKSIKDKVTEIIDRKDGKALNGKDQQTIERLNVLLDRTNDVVSKRADATVSALKGLGYDIATDDDELDIDIVYNNELEDTEIVYSDELEDDGLDVDIVYKNELEDDFEFDLALEQSLADIMLEAEDEYDEQSDLDIINSLMQYSR